MIFQVNFVGGIECQILILDNAKKK